MVWALKRFDWQNPHHYRCVQLEAALYRPISVWYQSGGGDLLVVIFSNNLEQNKACAMSYLKVQ